MIKKTLGDGEKQPTNTEKKNLTTNRVSIVTLCEISEGSIISEKMIDVRRPGDGIPPKYYDEIIGRKAKTNIAKETTLKWDYLV